MNIEDARKTYSSVIKDFWTERNSLFHQKEEAEKKYNETTQYMELCGGKFGDYWFWWFGGC